MTTIRIEYYENGTILTKRHQAAMDRGERLCQIYVDGRYYGTAAEKGGLFQDEYRLPKVWMSKEQLACCMAMNRLQQQRAILNLEYDTVEALLRTAAFPTPQSQPE